MNIGWYINRLRRMSVPEIGYRARKTLQSRLESRGVGVAETIPQPNIVASAGSWAHPAADIDKDKYIAAAERILRGKLSIFALDDVEVGFPPRWNRDYRTGKDAPLAFGKLLNYRDENLVGDIKYLWEPNRHLHLVTLAQAYYLSKDKRYLDGLQQALSSWFDQCPYNKGPNWTSALELAIRLINWSVIWKLVGGVDSPLFEGVGGRDFKTTWIASIYRHMHFIAGYFSRYSSANNHLIGEAAGLLVGSLQWPYWRECLGWRGVATRILEEEAVKQVTEDGVDREQTTAYQQFVFEFLLTAGLAARAAGSDFSSRYWQRLERMAEFILAVRDAGGNVPMIGDADDGFVTRLDPAPQFDPFRSMLATAAILFGRSDFQQAAGAVDERNLWLFGEQGKQDFAMAKTASSQPKRSQFPEAGYFVLSHREGTEDEIKIVVDAGPLGYSAIAAHGHADALAFTLSCGGAEILVDPGTYAYHTQKKWRDYFRGTSAHNTVRVDRQDQSVIGGNFMWMQHANAHCTKFVDSAQQGEFEGWHDGYVRLPDSVKHRRNLRLDGESLHLQVVDELECNASHSVEQFWHFAENVAVRIDGHRAFAEIPGWQVRFDFDQAFASPLLVRGDETRPLGWVSRRFDVKQPTVTIVCSADISGSSTFTTRVSFRQLR